MIEEMNKEEVFINEIKSVLEERNATIADLVESYESLNVSKR